MKTALITGASSGIGLELARLFAKNHYNLVIVARRKEKLNEIQSELENDYGVSITTIPLDLIENDAVSRLYELTKKQNLSIDVLINNAGFGLQGAFKDTDLDAEKEMIHLNITVLTDLTKRFLKDMIPQKSGRILNVSSTAAFYPGPYMSVYYATKAYVQSFTLALAHEFRNTGITISALCPGPTATEFQKRAGVEDSMLFSNKMMPVSTAKEVAKAAYEGLMKGEKVIVPGIMNKLSAWSSGVTPGFISNRLIESLHKE